MGEKGVICEIDDTSNTPEKQFRKFKNSIVHENITAKDIYHQRNKKESYDNFINKLESKVNLSEFILEIENLGKTDNMATKNQPLIKEILFLLIAQLDTRDAVLQAEYMLYWINKAIQITMSNPLTDWIFDFDEAMGELTKNVTIYKNLFGENNFHLVTDSDLTNPKLTLDTQPGSIPYLSMVSHSLSHTFMTEKIKSGLSATFGSPRKRN